MFAISPTTLAAFERAALDNEIGQFAAWWNGFAELIGPITAQQAEPLLAAATAAASDIGVTDNAFHRIWIQAVALRLFPDPTGEQFLLLTDAIFDSPDDAARIHTLLSLRGRA